MPNKTTSYNISSTDWTKIIDNGKSVFAFTTKSDVGYYMRVLDHGDPVPPAGINTKTDRAAFVGDREEIISFESECDVYARTISGDGEISILNT